MIRASTVEQWGSVMQNVVAICWRRGKDSGICPYDAPTVPRWVFDPGLNCQVKPHHCQRAGLSSWGLVKRQHPVRGHSVYFVCALHRCSRRNETVFHYSSAADRIFATQKKRICQHSSITLACAHPRASEATPRSRRLPMCKRATRRPKRREVCGRELRTRRRARTRGC